jgi:hypothetical protein
LNLEPWVWVSPLVYLVLINGAPNLGTRYLLPAFPFFLLIGGKSAAWLWNRGGGPNWKGGAGIALLLLLWHGSETLACFPGHLSYFNELVPSRGKIHFLGDWNLDVSQDHERLAALARVKGWSNIKLAYLGGTDPYFYGLRWRPWTEKDLSGPQRGTTYLVNAAFLQEAPCFFSSTLPIAKSWISNLKQDQRLGDTWYYVEGPPGTPEEDKTSNLPSVPVFKYVWNLKTNQREKP